MLTSNENLSGSKAYISALTDPGNARSATMPRNNSATALAISLPLAAEVKVMRLHQKPLLDVRSREPSTSTQATSSHQSMISVYTAKPLQAARVSAEMMKYKKRSKTKSPMLAKRASLQLKEARRLDVSPIRRPLMLAGDVRRSNGGTPSSTASSLLPPGEKEKKLTKIYLSQKQSGVIKDCGTSVPCAPPATPTPGEESSFLWSQSGWDSSYLVFFICVYRVCVCLFVCSTFSVYIWVTMVQNFDETLLTF